MRGAVRHYRATSAAVATTASRLTVAVAEVSATIALLRLQLAAATTEAARLANNEVASTDARAIAARALEETRAALAAIEAVAGRWS